MSTKIWEALSEDQRKRILKEIVNCLADQKPLSLATTKQLPGPALRKILELVKKLPAWRSWRGSPRENRLAYLNKLLAQILQPPTPEGDVTDSLPSQARDQIRAQEGLLLKQADAQEALDTRRKLVEARRGMVRD